MNKWFRFALNAFIGIVVLNLLVSILFGGGIFFSIGALLALVLRLLYFALVVGIIMGLVNFIKEMIS